MNCAQTEPRHAQAGAAEIMCRKSSTVRATELEPGLYGGTEFSVNRFGGDTDRASAVYAGTEPLVADGPFRPERLIPLTVPQMMTIPVSPVQCSRGRQISTSQHPTSGADMTANGATVAAASTSRTGLHPTFQRLRSKAQPGRRADAGELVGLAWSRRRRLPRNH
jgi:hypothetical protein